MTPATIVSLFTSHHLTPSSEAPWRPSEELKKRADSKPTHPNFYTKRCVVLPSDREMTFAKTMFSFGLCANLLPPKYENLTIKRVYQFDSSKIIENFESSLLELEKREVELKASGLTDAKIAPSWRELASRWHTVRLSKDGPELENLRVFPFCVPTSFETAKSLAESSFEFSKNFRAQFVDADKEDIEDGDQTQKEGGFFLFWICVPRSCYELRKQSGQDVQKEAEADQNEYPQKEDSAKRPSSANGTTGNYNILNSDSRIRCLPGLWVDLAPENELLVYSVDEAMNAAEEGNLSQLQKWITQKPSRIWEKTSEGETLAYAALYGNQLPVLEWIYSVAKDLLLEIRNDKKDLFILAALSNRFEILKWLVGKVKPINPVNFYVKAKNYGCSPKRIHLLLKTLGWPIRYLPPKPAHFIKRDELLSSLVKQFQTPFHQVVETKWMDGNVVNLVGPEGIGKSTLAAAYAEQFEKEYDYIYWIKAHQGTMKSGLSDLMPEMFIKEQSPKGIRYIIHSRNPNCRNWYIEKLRALEPDLEDYDESHGLLTLATDYRPYPSEKRVWDSIFADTDNSKRLIIIDDACVKYFPELIEDHAIEGHILITSSTYYLGKQIVVPPFSSEESVRLLTLSTGYAATEEAFRLAEKLEHLPLALSQAALYMKRTSTSYSSYIELYDQEEEKFNGGLFPPGSYPVNLAITTKISIDRLKAIYPKAIPVFHRTLYLDYQDIPKLFFASGDLSEDELNTSLEHLKDYGLLKPGRNPATYSVPKGIHNIFRDQLSPEEQSDAKSGIIDMFDREWQYQSNEPENWGYLATLKEPFERFANLWGTEQEAITIFSKLGLFIQIAEGDLSSAISFHKKALKISEKLFGGGDAVTAGILYKIGLAECALGKFEQSVATLTRSFDIRQRIYKGNWEKLGSAATYLAGAYQQLGDKPKAVAFFEQAFEFKTKAYGTEHREIVQGLIRLGFSYLLNDQFERSVESLEKGVELAKKIYGDDHLETAIALNDLAYSLETGCDRRSLTTNVNLDYLLRAYQAYEKSIKITDKIYGKNSCLADHFKNRSTVVLDSVEGVWDIDRLAKDPSMKKYKSYAQVTLKIRELLSEQKSEKYLIQLAGLAEALGGENKYDACIQTIHNYLQIKKQVNLKLKPSDIALPMLMSLMGVCYQGKNDLEKALKYQEDGLEGLKAIPRGDGYLLHGRQETDFYVNKLIFSMHESLAEVYRTLGQPQKAHKIHREGLRFLRLLTRRDEKLESRLDSLAVIYAEKDPEAAAMFRRSPSLLTNPFGWLVSWVIPVR